MVVHRLNSIDRWMLRLPIVTLSIGVLFVALLKHGIIFWKGWNDGEFPPTDLIPGTTSPIIFGHTLAIARVFRLQTVQQYQFVSVLILVLTIAVLLVLTFRRLPRNSGSLLIFIVLFGQVGVVLFGLFGRQDTLFILGAALIMLTGKSNRVLWTTGALLMAFANPAVSIFASLLLLFLAMTTRYRLWRERAIIATGIGLFWVAAESVLGAGQSQFGLFRQFLESSIFASGFTFPLRVFSIYGIVWILVILVLLSYSRHRFWWLAFVLVVAPVLVTLLTLDGTRVGVGVTLLVLFALLVRDLPEACDAAQKRGIPLISLGAIATLVVPAINDWGGGIVAPGGWFMELLALIVA